MINLKEALTFIDPSALNYEEWLEIGMGLKSAADNGDDISWQDWDNWSSRDPARYQSGICKRKWSSFNSTGITKGTIIYQAMQNGFKPFDVMTEFDWDDVIEKDQRPVTNDFVKFIETVFKPEDLVSYVTAATQDKNGKYYPANAGVYGIKAKKLVNNFTTIEDSIGDYTTEAGAWIRFNPMDGKGVKNENVIKFRYTLVESDQTDISSQLELIYKLRLPCVAITYSGSKSVHALVKVNAKDKEEYDKRVQFIYQTLKKQEFEVDEANKNPARLTRLPGVRRGDQYQTLIDTNTGYNDFEMWREYVENNFREIELPEIKSMSDFYFNPPELAPELIKGVLRQGHKMLIAGSSKAGKSFCLIELGLALAHGKPWLGFECKKSKVLYINLEIDEASFVNRCNNVHEIMKYPESDLENFTVWNLRGLSQPLYKLSPKIIKRVRDCNYDVIILDPVYKVQSGDENAAGDIAAFTNEFDRIATELGVSMIYCHHHSKGNQGGKRAIDRASGSGVFARDPDAIIDMIELDNETYKHNDRYKNLSAWRVEGTLREFAPFKPINIFFNFPVHEVDYDGILDNAEYRDYTIKSSRSNKTEQDKINDFDFAFEQAAFLSDEENVCDEEELRKELGNITKDTLRRKLWDYNNNLRGDKYKYSRSKGKVIRSDFICD